MPYCWSCSCLRMKFCALKTMRSYKIRPTTCLESHMLQKVSCSVILLIFISASSINPEPNLNVTKAQLSKATVPVFGGKGSGDGETAPSFF